MISKLTGLLDSALNNQLILDVQGVGYQVFCSSKTLSQAGQAGDPLSLYIETQVREDHIHLYGFKDRAEQDWFRLLTSVQGVGAKAALAILSVSDPSALMLAIASQDKAVLTRADGVGPKLATRIITELKDKAGDMSFGKTQENETVHAAPNTGQAASQSFEQDAVSALINLGYARSDAFSAVMQAKQKANDNDLASVEAMIRLALKELSS